MFKDYKILVDNEDESKEVQEALFKLGYKWKNGQVTPMLTNYKVLTTYADGFIYFGVSKGCFEEHENGELTIPQLKDLVKDVTHTNKEIVDGIPSDGGSSDYYFTKLPQELIDQIVKTGGIEIKDIARYVYDNNADAFNIIKAQKRIIEANKGVGKAGITKLYDAKKIKFFANEQYEAIKREGTNE